MTNIFTSSQIVGVTHPNFSGMAHKWAMSTIGSRLKSLRMEVPKADRPTQADIAVLVDISRPHLANVENDADTLSLPKLQVLADHYGVCLDWLIEGRGPKYRDPRREALMAALDAILKDERETYIRVIFERGSRPGQSPASSGPTQKAS